MINDYFIALERFYGAARSVFYSELGEVFGGFDDVFGGPGSVQYLIDLETPSDSGRDILRAAALYGIGIAPIP